MLFLQGGNNRQLGFFEVAQIEVDAADTLKHVALVHSKRLFDGCTLDSQFKALDKGGKRLIELLIFFPESHSNPVEDNGRHIL